MCCESLLIIITDNNWLYAGLSELLQDILSLQLRLSDKAMPGIIKEASRVLVLVDSRIILRGEWSSFNAIKKLRPDCTTIWLTRMETGKIFPKECHGDRTLPQNLDIASLQKVLRRAMQNAVLFDQEEKVREVNLTLTERRLLPLYVSNPNIHMISRLTGKSLKALYTHRQNILTKTGFKHPAFLQFIYNRNNWLP